MWDTLFLTGFVLLLASILLKLYQIVNQMEFYEKTNWIFIFIVGLLGYLLSFISLLTLVADTPSYFALIILTNVMNVLLWILTVIEVVLVVASPDWYMGLFAMNKKE